MNSANPQLIHEMAQQQIAAQMKQRLQSLAMLIRDLGAELRLLEANKVPADQADCLRRALQQTATACVNKASELARAEQANNATIQTK